MRTINRCKKKTHMRVLVIIIALLFVLLLILTNMDINRRKYQKRKLANQQRRAQEQDPSNRLRNDEHTALLETLQRIVAAGPDREFTELTVAHLVQLTASRKSLIRTNAQKYLSKLQNSSQEEQNALLSLRAAKYLKPEPAEDGSAGSREELARDIHQLMEIAERIILEEEQRKIARDRERDRSRSVSEQRLPPSSTLFAVSSQHSISGEDEPMELEQPLDSHGFRSNDEVRDEYEQGRLIGLENEVLPRQIGQIDLSDEDLAILSRSENDPKFSDKVILSHYAVWKRMPLQNTTHLLKLLHEYQVQIDLVKLPKTARTLLKITPSDIEGTKIYDIFAPVRIGAPPEKTASYLHLGLRNALIGKSCGLVAKWQYINTIRSIFVLFPELVPAELQELIRPQKGEEYDKDLLKYWASLSKKQPEDNDPSSRASSSARSLVLQIHGHIDGVQWFINSTQPQGVPILARLVGIRDEVSGESVKIPTLDPFVVGVMQKYQKTDTKKFVSDFVNELKTLSDRRLSNLSFKVELVCMICDAPQRAECKGIVGATGYYACERCVVAGEHYAGSMRYPELDKRLRKDEAWEDYDKPEYNESVRTRTHRKPGTTSMFHAENGVEIYHFPLVSGFALETQHLIDGGVVKDLHEAFEFLTTDVWVDAQSSNPARMSIRDTEVKDRISFLNAYCLSEQARKLRSLKFVKKWKMREHHVFFMYFLYDLLAPIADRLDFGKQLLLAVKHLLLALHLIKGFSAEPLPPETLERARKHIRLFIEIYTNEVQGLSAMTYKMHSLIHLIDDLVKYLCHMEFLSSYKYENFHSKWKTWLRSGNKPLEQIRNRLVEVHKYLLPISGATNLISFMGLSKQHIEHMREKRTTELPPSMFKEALTTILEGKEVIQKVGFVGFTLTKVFPQNICLMRDGSTVYCDNFYKTDEDERPIIAGFKFQKAENVFVEPYNSSDIGKVNVWDIGLERKFWSVDDVWSKCYAFPQNPQQRSLNPLPDVVRKATTFETRRQAFNSVFEKLDIVSWNIQSLLQPPDATIARMVNS